LSSFYIFFEYAGKKACHASYKEAILT